MVVARAWGGEWLMDLKMFWRLLHNNVDVLNTTKLVRLKMAKMGSFSLKT